MDRGVTMWRGKKWQWTAALLAGLWAASLAQAGEKSSKPEPEKKGNWFTRMFSKKEKPEDKKSEKDAAPKAPLVNSAAGARSRELSNYLRRLAVCDQLMQVAYDTKDDELQHQVDQLKDRVWTTYQMRTERIAGGAARFESDEQILDKHLGSRASVKEQTEETLLGKNATRNNFGRTALKENKP